MTEPIKHYGSPRRGVAQADVSQAADALLRAGERPTVERIRAAIGSGSPNTVGPLLDKWWSRLAARLDAGPAALHRLPESVAHVAEALWMQALDEGRQRAQLELKASQRTAAEQQQALAVRSHVLSLREGELDARLRDRENTISELNMQLHELTLILRKEQATRAAQARRIAALEEQILARRPAAKPGRPKARLKRTSGNANRRAARRPKLRLIARRKKPKSGRHR